MLSFFVCKFKDGTTDSNAPCPCPNGAGDYSNPSDETNSTYVSCGNGCVWHVMPCPGGLVFYEELEMCWYPCRIDDEGLCQEVKIIC